MYLSRLDIQGFKSFANKVTLDFQPGITAIVGPNGSGKSNVADAIRWVLGEQSLKLLRGKKSDDVIFAGSDKKARLGAAEVSLYLNNEDHSAPIEYSELVIGRRVFRDGQGEYLINHQPARLQDIQLLLAQANFGQRTYSVIGQGMIDSFLISSPQDRKHLFDEAAGVRQYQLKKEQTLSRLAQAQENIRRGETVMMEIEPRLRSLTRQVKRLERREEIEQRLRQSQRQYFGLLWQQLAGEIGEVVGQFSTLDEQRQAIQQELAAIQQELEHIERERSASEIFSGLQKTYNAILDEKNRLLEEQASIKAKLESSAGAVGATETVFWQHRADEATRKLRELDEELTGAREALERKRRAVVQAEKDLATHESAFTKLQEDISALEKKLQQQFTLSEVKSAVSGFFAKYHAFVEDLHRRETVDLAIVRKTTSALRDELSQVVDRLASADADPADLSALQRSVVTMAKERQDALESLLHRRNDVNLETQRIEQLETSRRQLADDQTRVQKEISGRELAASDPSAAYATFMAEAKAIEQRIAATDERLKTARTDINNFNTTETSKKERLFTLQKEFRDTQHRLNVATNAANEIQVKRAKLEQRQEDLKREIGQAMTAEAVQEIASATEKLDGDVTLLAEDIGHLQHQLQLIGGIDEQITAEYQETNERWEFLNAQAEDLKAAIGSLEQAVGELDGIIKERFDAAFKKINEEFHQYFRTLFRGGKAELVLVKEIIAPETDEDDEDEKDEEGPAVAKPEPVGEKVVTGIDIKATPPGKKLQSIAMLSGGERALTSIALLCAIISNNPSPFVALDEVDAALDEANSQRFAAILDHLAHKTQFITITHNRATMEKAKIMYGVTMGEDGVSQLLSVKMDEAEEIIRKHGNR